MAVVFHEKEHKYVSIDASENITWTSVTTLVGKYKDKFDSDAIAAKCAVNKKSKWFGLTPEKIQEVWKNESDRACDLGNFYHNREENKLLAEEEINLYNETLPVIQLTTNEDGLKMAPEQQLSPGVYPELFVYLKSAGVCGQSDRVDITSTHVHIKDYKTNKEIQKKSFVNWDGVSKKMKAPLSHLDDCNFVHYSLQLSIYMYIILRHNPKLKPGNMEISHVAFEEEEKPDTYGYPIHKLNENGEPIVKSVTIYQMPYLKQEVRKLLELNAI